MATIRQQFRGATVTALAVHGSLTTRQVQALLLPGASHRAVQARLTRMSERDVVQQLSGHLGVTCWAATPNGLAEFGIALPAVKNVGPSTARHGHVVSEVVIALQQRGDRVTTERELRQAALLRLKAFGFATKTDGGRVRILLDGSRAPNTSEGTQEWLNAWTPEHLPDLCVEPQAPGHLSWAVEVELNSKATHLIDQKLNWYRTQASQYSGVVYYCGSPSVTRSVQRAAERTGVTDILRVYLLPNSFLDRAVQA